MQMKKRVFGRIEAAFDILYLLSAFIIGIYLLCTGNLPVRILAGSMALLLVFGDAFHLLPRIGVILTDKEEHFTKALGIGKLITSITMTIFYLFLWHIGLMLFQPDASFLLSLPVYILALLRILLCLLPQNRWTDRYPPVRFGIYRNVPFFLLGLAVALLFAIHMDAVSAVNVMWLAIALSFGFYLPVVLWSNENPKLGMLMLPKTCCYLWMLVMCLKL
jgi:hypothetical protein